MANKETSSIDFKPSMHELRNAFCCIVDNIVMSVHNICRVEQFLFEKIESVDIGYLRSVLVTEEVVLTAKERIANVVNKNNHGLIK